MKTRIVALLLAWFCGVMGFHNFYLNDNKTGIIKFIVFLISIPMSLIVIGFFGLAALVVWQIVDFIKLANLTDEEFNKLYNK